MQPILWDRKVLVMIVLCFGAMLASTVSTLWDQTTFLGRANAMRHDKALFLACEELEHELQKERGLSVTLRSSPDNIIFREKLIQQQDATNQSLHRLINYVDKIGDHEGRKSAVLYEELLESARQLVTDGASPNAVLASYKNIIDACQAKRAMRLHSFSGREGILATVYQNLSVLEENAGIERALISRSIAEGNFSPRRLAELSELIGRETTHLNFSKSLLEPDELNRLNQTLESDPVTKSDQVRNQILESGEPPESLTADQWWNLQSGKIRAIHQFQQILADEIEVGLQRATNRAYRNLLWALFLSFLPILGFFVLIYTGQKQKKFLKTSLSQAQRRESLLLQECHEAVFMLSGDQIVDCNDQMLSLLGIQRREALVGFDLSAMVGKDAPDADSQLADWETYRQQAMREGYARFESRLKTIDGEPVLGEITLSCIELEGNRSKIMGMIFDVGERRKLERQLSEARKLEAIGQLSAGIAHEINTPLQCVLSNIEFIQEGLERVLQVTDQYRSQAPLTMSKTQHEEMEALEKKLHFEQTRVYLLESTSESAIASERIVDILRAMKTISYQGGPQKQSCDLNHLIKDACTISANRWKTLADLDLRLDDRIKDITANPAQISQVMLNMIVNAADAIFDRIGPDPVQRGCITIETKLVDDCVDVRIKDTGCGIPESKIYNIFDPFFTTKDVGKGTGQGLTIVYDVITNQHQGHISVESEAGVGTQFQITLPVRPKENSNAQDNGTVSDEMAKDDTRKNGPIVDSPDQSRELESASQSDSKSSDQNDSNTLQTI